MRKHTLVFVIIGAILSLFLLAGKNHTGTWSSESNLSDLLKHLGAPPQKHAVEKIDLEKARKGELIVKRGWSDSSLVLFKRPQSKFYTCIACHSTEQEYTQLNKITPESRLQKSIDDETPYLQGSSLYGVVNRESWYNGDYEARYGALVLPAQDNLFEAIQLCATQCSQGTALNDSDLESVVHYLWTLQLKLKDLNLNSEEVKILLKENTSNEVVNILKEKYPLKMEGTFLQAPLLSEIQSGNPEIGQAIYQYSCMHCHEGKRFTSFPLDYSPLTFNYLKNQLGTNKKSDLLRIIRDGTHSLPGYRAYMPLYTKEKLSNQQLNDLIAYIKQQSL